MTIPRAFLVEWAKLIAGDQLVHHATTRYRVRDWRTTLTLPLDFTWQDAGFSTAKLKQLTTKYPPDALPPDGCIEGMWMTPDGRRRQLEYRRVDLTKGWMADVLYLQHLGWTGPVEFKCDGLEATIHAVRFSCVFPLIVREGEYRGVHRLLRKTLKRAVIHRAESRYSTYGQAARANKWAHRLSTVDEMQKAIRVLESDGTPIDECG